MIDTHAVGADPSSELAPCDVAAVLSTVQNGTPRGWVETVALPVLEGETLIDACQLEKTLHLRRPRTEHE
jgi:hypothetical protein